MPPLLRLKDLSVSFPHDGGLQAAVRDVSLSLERAAITCIVGESGCGKSLTCPAGQALAGPFCALCPKRP